LQFSGIDVGDGWLIFALPAAELAVHPGSGSPELYLMCDDLDRTLSDLKRKGVQVKLPVKEPRWGRLVSIRLPGGGELSLYEPRHPRPTPK
jgi:predicted enzyme related to lactoylglutathione lyase